MNIFVLDKEPRKAAAYHVDKHVPKMIVESAQMLSTAHHALDEEESIEGIYKAAHLNHPCTIWVRESKQNYEWLLELALGLVDEYHIRYGHKTHKTEKVLDTLKNAPKKIVPWGLTYFAQAMPDEYKDDDPVQAYRKFYMGEKRPFATWKTQQPYWWITTD